MSLKQSLVKLVLQNPKIDFENDQNDIDEGLSSLKFYSISEWSLFPDNPNLKSYLKHIFKI